MGNIRIEILQFEGDRIQRLRLTRHVDETSGIFVFGKE